MYIDADDYDAQDAAAEDRAERRYHSRLMAHLDCRDPDHPGCKYCEGGNDARDGDDE